MFLFRGEPNITLSKDILSPEPFIMLFSFLNFKLQHCWDFSWWESGCWRIQLQVFVWLLPLRKIPAWNSHCFHRASLIGVALKNPLWSLCVSWTGKFSQEPPLSQSVSWWMMEGVEMDSTALEPILLTDALCALHGAGPVAKAGISQPRAVSLPLHPTSILPQTGTGLALPGKGETAGLGWLSLCMCLEKGDISFNHLPWVSLCSSHLQKNVWCKSQGEHPTKAGK